MIFIIWLILHIFDEYTNQKHTVYIYTIYPFKQRVIIFSPGVVPAFQQGITTVWNP